MLTDPDPAPVVAVVEEWVFDLASRMPLPWNLHSAIDVLNTYLFQEVGLQGDRETYDDPANAALPQVIARKRGMPISLAILWMEVARRLGFRAVGVALPGHFIAGLELDLGTLYFDVFNGGQAVGEEGAGRLVEQATGGRASFDPAMLAPVTNRAILVRLVRNLHVRFVRAQAWEEALWTSTHLVLLAPEESLPYRDRAFVHFKRGEMMEGISDLHEAIRLSQDLDPELMQWMEKLQGG
jgi:regulator of sirC expression with transglutaminase-like and TPR domain